MMKFFFPLAVRQEALGYAQVLFSHAPRLSGASLDLSFEVLPTERFPVEEVYEMSTQICPQLSNQGCFYWSPSKPKTESEHWRGASSQFTLLLASLHARHSFDWKRSWIWSSGRLPQESGRSGELLSVDFVRQKLCLFLDIAEKQSSLERSVFLLPLSSCEQLSELQKDTRLHVLEWNADRESIVAELCRERACFVRLIQAVSRFFRVLSRRSKSSKPQALLVYIPSIQLVDFIRQTTDLVESKRYRTVSRYIKWCCMVLFCFLCSLGGLSVDMGLCRKILRPAHVLFPKRATRNAYRLWVVEECHTLCRFKCSSLSSINVLSKDSLTRCSQSCFTREINLLCRDILHTQKRPIYTIQQLHILQEHICRWYQRKKLVVYKPSIHSWTQNTCRNGVPYKHKIRFKSQYTRLVYKKKIQEETALFCKKWRFLTPRSF